MAWTRGPGELSSVSVNGVSVDASLVEGFSTDTAPDTFSTAAGFDAERGSVLKTWTFNNLDYSTVGGMLTLMTGRTEADVVATYVDTAAQTLNNAIIRVTPILHPVTDTCHVYIAAAGTTKDSLTGAFTDGGILLGNPTVSFEWPFDGKDGCGRPYFSSCRLTSEFIVPGDGTVTTPYSTFAAFQGTKVDVAFTMPGGNFLCFDDVYCYIFYANEDASQPRSVRVRLVGVGASWASLISYSDGAATAVTTAWGTDGAVDPGDMFAGAAVEATGFATAETSLATWA